MKIGTRVCLCIVCTSIFMYFRRQKSFNKRRSEQSVILFSNKIFHTFIFSQTMKQK